MKHITCIGSVTSDVFVQPADQLPPTGTLVGIDNLEVHMGGCASNAAMDLSILGIPVSLICRLGRDTFGDFVMKAVSDAGIGHDGITYDDEASSTVSIVLVNSAGERSFFYNPGAVSKFTLDHIDMGLIEKTDIVFVAGANLLNSFDGKPCAELMRRAQTLGKYTVMDTAWDFQDIWLDKVFDVMPHLDLFMPSIEEAQKISGLEDPGEIADRFFEWGVKNVVIKLGKKGALICEAGKDRVTLPTYSEIKPVDTTGAGDSFCAGFLAGLSQGWDYKKSGELANAVGTHCVMRVGASSGIKPLGDILEFMRTHTAG